MRLLLVSFLSLGIYFCLHSQSVAVGTTTPEASAAFEVESANQGVLLTRMTTTQRKAIANPALGLLVFDTDKHTLYLYDGVAWRPLIFGVDDRNLPPLEILANDGLAGDSFGRAVAIDGDYAVIGAPEDKVGNNSVQGSAYLFRRENGIWTQQAHLVAPDGASEDYFGNSVDIDGDNVLIGASGDDINGVYGQGSAYLFKRTGTAWNLDVKLTALDGAESDHFGTAVAIHGDRAIIGAPYNDIGFSVNQGSVYIFKKVNGVWSQENSLSPADASAGDEVGASVAIQGATIMFGAPGDDDGSFQDIGSAYIYQKPGLIWVQQAKLVPSGSASNFNFGDAVSLSGTSAAVGCPKWDGLGHPNCGAVFLYTWNGVTWTFQVALNSPAIAAAGYFGAAIALAGATIVIGEPLADIQYNTDEGRLWVYQYTGTTWELSRGITDGSGVPQGNLGWSVGLDGAQVVSGAYRKYGNRGAGFFIDLE